MSQPDLSTTEPNPIFRDSNENSPGDITNGSKPTSRKPSIISKSSNPIPSIINNRHQSISSIPSMQTHELIPIPSNLQSSIPLSKANPSVKFNDDSAQERSRRFTISSQPSAISLSSQPQQPQQQFVQPSISRSASLLKLSKDSTEGLSFLPNIQTKIHSNMLSPNSSRVNSPDHTTPRLNTASFASFDTKTKRMKSVSPPPSTEEQKSSQSIPSIVASQPLNESSRRNSKTEAINISRKNSTKKSKKIVVASPVGPPVPFQQFLTFEDDGKFHILLACTGSVATIKVPLIIDKLFQIYGTNKISIQLVVTKAATHFLKGLKIHNDVKIWRDEDEWANYEYSTTETTASKKPKNPFDKMILHNELRRWADIMLISPLSANTLAKIANGISDNLLTNIIRAWGPQQSNIKKPILAAPAMNTFMYTHPITAKQLSILSSPDWFGIEILKPVEKVLVCGDIGMGGMREWSEVVDILRRRISSLKAERAKLDGEVNVDEVEEDDEEEEHDEDDREIHDDEDDGDNEGDDDDDDDEDDEDDDDDDDDDDEEEDEDKGDNNDLEIDHGTTNNENHIRKSPKLKQDDSDDDLIFEITDQDGEDGTQIEQKLPIPKETQNII